MTDQSNTRRDLTPAFWREMSLKLPPSPVIFDLGAHGMEEAQLLLPLLSGRPSWHSFEANPACCAHIRQHILGTLQPLGEIILNEVAISHQAGTTKLYRSGKTDGQPWTPSSSIKKPNRATEFFPWMTFDDGIEVNTTTLDEYCKTARTDRIDLLKMDIQGAEGDAIRGGFSTFAKTTYVITEVGSDDEYEGQLGLDELLAALPGEWTVVERFIGDALLKRR